MSDHLSEEKVLVSSSGFLEQYDFDDKLYEAFTRHLEGDLGITERVELGGGLSGARTSSVRLEGNGDVYNKKGQYILKVCLSEKAEREIRMHKAAKASSILRRYVPELITFKSYP